MFNIFSILKKIISYVQIIDIYENTGPILNISNKEYKLYIYNSFNDIKDRKILNYFIKYKNKKIRFKKKQLFLVLKKKKLFLSSGWIYKGKNWYIEEIDKKIFLKNKTVLFDFITLDGHRNKGYYSKLLSLISKKFKGKRLMIYTLRNNIYSSKGIKKSGFNFVKSLRKI